MQQTLIERAQDSRNPVVSEAERNQLWVMGHAALAAGKYGAAMAYVEALLCQAERGNVCPDKLAICTTAFRDYSVEMLQPLFDRVMSLNYLIDNR